ARRPRRRGRVFQHVWFYSKKAGRFPGLLFALYRPAAGESGKPRSEQGPGPKKQARCKSGVSIRKLWFCCAGRQNCEAPKKSQRQAGGKAPERRRPLWTPSDGNAANGLFWLDFAAKLPCAHSAKREGHRIACTDAASG